MAYWDIFQNVILFLTLSCKPTSHNVNVMLATTPKFFTMVYITFLIWLGQLQLGDSSYSWRSLFDCFTNLSYLHVLASGSNTSMVFKYVVPSKPPTAISCPFTTARPTCKTTITDSSYLAGMS